MMQRRSLAGLFGATLAGLVWPGIGRAQPAATTLFTIARSKNANVVRYQARTRGGGLDQSHPIDAYWLMLAEDGRREELSWAERKLAYGFSVFALTEERCVLSLLAFKERPVVIERRGQAFRASTKIAGKRAILERIFVQASEGGLLPSVLYLDVFGTSSDGSPLRERISSR
jgi:hypothetical protein